MIATLQACAVFESREPNWPNNIPSQDYFLQVYRQDTTNSRTQDINEYMRWVVCFYQGTELYPNGWNHIAEGILLNIKDPEIANTVKDKLDQLGLVISAEWAKNNQTRLINTRHVSIWGNALIKSLEQGETLELMDRVSNDVEDILAGRISAEAITADRFYAEEDVLNDIN